MSTKTKKPFSLTVDLGTETIIIPDSGVLAAFVKLNYGKIETPDVVTCWWLLAPLGDKERWWREFLESRGMSISIAGEAYPNQYDAILHRFYADSKSNLTCERIHAEHNVAWSVGFWRCILAATNNLLNKTHRYDLPLYPELSDESKSIDADSNSAVRAGILKADQSEKSNDIMKDSAQSNQPDTAQIFDKMIFVESIDTIRAQDGMWYTLYEFNVELAKQGHKVLFGDGRQYTFGAHNPNADPKERVVGWGTSRQFAHDELGRFRGIDSPSARIFLAVKSIPKTIDCEMWANVDEQGKMGIYSSERLAQGSQTYRAHFTRPWKRVAVKVRVTEIVDSKPE